MIGIWNRILEVSTMGCRMYVDADNAQGTGVGRGKGIARYTLALHFAGDCSRDERAEI